MKKISGIIIAAFLCLFPVFSQEEDDFDSIFEGAEDIEEAVVEEEKKAETPVQVVASAFSSMVHFSGNFTGELGLLYIKDNDENTKNEPSGYFTTTPAMPCRFRNFAGALPSLSIASTP